MFLIHSFFDLLIFFSAMLKLDHVDPLLFNLLLLAVLVEVKLMDVIHRLLKLPAGVLFRLRVPLLQYQHITLGDLKILKPYLKALLPRVYKLKALRPDLFLDDCHVYIIPASLEIGTAPYPRI